MTKKTPKNSVNVVTRKDENPDDAVARTLTRPEIQAACTIQQWQGDVTEVNALARALSLQIDDVNNGSMKRPEAMLLAQAHTLDELFNNLARRAHKHDTLIQFETCLRLALKAQSQCRTTLETLAAIKNPPVIFARQANFANNQQVNNATPAPASHAGEIKNQPNELLEAKHGDRLDTREKTTAIGTNPVMEALE